MAPSLASIDSIFRFLFTIGFSFQPRAFPPSLELTLERVISSRFVKLIPLIQHRAVTSRGGVWGALAPQFLDKQLSLSQPGGQIIPTTVLGAPTLQQPCNRFTRGHRSIIYLCILDTVSVNPPIPNVYISVRISQSLFLL